ncbi:MAG: SMC-Scp complex subunit ScpB [Candidatus Eisenbacteria bacterium]|nr:SMC-Scp complex subunit ScpB [Candidatus Eisenbacteria bacterium]
MADPDIRKIVEAVLFAADAPVPLDKLTDILEGVERNEVREALRELAAQFDTDGRPYSLTEVAGGWQAYCRPEYAKWVRELHRGRLSTRLSQAALETLAIVAYKQPIVRAEIEAIRGVDSSGVLATLMRRDLITIAGRAPGMGRALMYRTTREFLRYFGLNFVTDLPRLEEFAEVLGLKPGELELAVEGAESLAGVAEDVGEVDELVNETAPGYEGEEGDDARWDGEESSEEEHVRDRPDTGGRPARRETVPIPPERHVISDRRLLDEIDED